MAKYWVTFQKFAGVEVEADSELEAEVLAQEIDESEYEFPQVDSNRWQLTNIEKQEN